MPHRHTCPSTQIPTSKTIKSMVVVSPLYPLVGTSQVRGRRQVLLWLVLLLHCQRWHWIHLPRQGGGVEEVGRIVRSVLWRFLLCRRVVGTSQVRGGLAYFPLDSHPPPPSTVVPAPYPETRGRSIIRRTPRPCCLLIFTLAWRRQWHLRLSPLLERQWPRAGSTSGMPLTCPWCCLLLNALRQRLRRQRQNYCWGKGSGVSTGILVRDGFPVVRCDPRPHQLSPRNQPRPYHSAP